VRPLSTSGRRPSWALGVKKASFLTCTEATPITDPDQVSRVVDSFRAKYGADQIAQHYPRPEVAVAAPLR